MDMSELEEVFRKMGKHMTYTELNRIIDLADSDGSGTLDYEEFTKTIFGSS